MIIQIRGTSGSGKTTVMREVVRQLGGFDSFQPVFRDYPKSKSPLYYIKDRIAVLGSYSNLCGGVDRLQAMGGYSLIQDVVRRCQDSADVLLMEGLLLSEDVKQSLLIKDFVEQARVLFLVTPLDTCIARVNERRKLHNRSRPLDTSLLSGRIRTIERARVRLDEAGVFCQRCPSEQAPSIILRWIRQAANA